MWNRKSRGEKRKMENGSGNPNEWSQFNQQRETERHSRNYLENGMMPPQQTPFPQQEWMGINGNGQQQQQQQYNGMAQAQGYGMEGYGPSSTNLNGVYWAGAEWQQNGGQGQNGQFLGGQGQQNGMQQMALQGNLQTQMNIGFNNQYSGVPYPQNGYQAMEAMPNAYVVPQEMMGNGMPSQFAMQQQTMYQGQVVNNPQQIAYPQAPQQKAPLLINYGNLLDDIPCNVARQGSSATPVLTQDLTLQSDEEGNRPGAPTHDGESPLNINADESLFKYPKANVNVSSFMARGFLDVHIRDALTLRKELYLNDVIINFMLTYIVLQLDRTLIEKIYLFNTFFYQKLTECGTGYPTDPQLDHMQLVENCKKVIRWTFRRNGSTNVDLFAKDYIIIPMNKSGNHWCVIVILNPAGAIIEEGAPDNDQRCKIILMDSMGGLVASHRNNYVDQITTWLEMLFNVSKREPSPFQLPLRYSFAKERVSLDVPRNISLQTNYVDCGAFLLHYVEMFFSRKPPIAPKDFPAFDWLEEFPESEKMAELMRQKTHQIIKRMSKERNKRLSRFEEFFQCGVSSESKVSKVRVHSAPHRRLRNNARQLRSFSYFETFKRREKNNNNNINNSYDTILNPREFFSMDIVKRVCRIDKNLDPNFQRHAIYM